MRRITIAIALLLSVPALAKDPCGEHAWDSQTACEQEATAAERASWMLERARGPGATVALADAEGAVTQTTTALSACLRRVDERRAARIAALPTATQDQIEQIPMACRMPSERARLRELRGLPSEAPPELNLSAPAPAHTMGGAVPCLMSAVLPGAGQFMNGQVAKGILQILASTALGMFVARAVYEGDDPTVPLVLYGLSNLAGMIDAFVVGEQLRNQAPSASPPARPAH